MKKIKKLMVCGVMIFVFTFCVQSLNSFAAVESTSSVVQTMTNGDKDNSKAVTEFEDDSLTQMSLSEKILVVTLTVFIFAFCIGSAITMIQIFKKRRVPNNSN